jgi:hypothetical protein
MQPIDSKRGKPGRFAGASGVVQGVLVVGAGTLIGGGLFGLVGITAKGSFLEQVLGGAAIGAVWGVLTATGFRHAGSAAVGAVIGWGIGTLWGMFHIAAFGALLGGYTGARFRSLQKANGDKPLSAKGLVVRTLSVLTGIIVGGFSGGVIAGSLCSLMAFGALPWRLPGTVDQGGLLIFAAGLLGGIVGAVFGGRCLYLWGVRRMAARPETEEVLKDYEQWKQEHLPRVEEANDDS